MELSGPDGPDDDDHWVTWKQGPDVLAATTWAEVDHGGSSARTGQAKVDRENATPRQRIARRAVLLRGRMVMENGTCW